MTAVYAPLDGSAILHYLFHPRRQHGNPPGDAYDLSIPVAENTAIVCRAYPAQKNNPWIIYFHGNGEVVSDYDGIAPLYNRQGLNLLVADYRGYGASGGRPSFRAMVDDAARIFTYAEKKLAGENETGGWFVMGRSLGSVSALELAGRFSGSLQGLIIESGFISVERLIDHLGLPSPGDLVPLEDHCRRLAEAIKLPALVIHGERDRLVPLKQGQELFHALGSGQKDLVIIPRADHNDIMFVDPEQYFQAIANFTRR